jgi:dTDP-4-dehydrorhamnose reductase
MTGGSGRLGRALAPLLDAVTPSHQDLNILQPSDLERALSQQAYAGIIHLAAITQPQIAVQKPQETYRANVTGTRHVAAAASVHHLKVIYLSSDYVFNGEKGDYREIDPVCPANWYGCTKAAGEMEVRASNARYCIVRTSFRPHPWGFPTAFTNVYTSADYVDIIAQEVTEVITRDLDGIIHVGTPIKTFFELARRRSPEVAPETCDDPLFPKRRNLNIDRWLSIKKGGPVS